MELVPASLDTWLINVLTKMLVELPVPLAELSQVQPRVVGWAPPSVFRLVLQFVVSCVELYLSVPMYSSATNTRLVGLDEDR